MGDLRFSTYWLTSLPKFTRSARFRLLLYLLGSAHVDIQDQLRPTVMLKTGSDIANEYGPL